MKYQPRKFDRTICNDFQNSTFSVDSSTNCLSGPIDLNKKRIIAHDKNTIEKKGTFTAKTTTKHFAIKSEIENRFQTCRSYAN